MTAKPLTMQEHLEAHARAHQNGEASVQQFITLLSLGEFQQAEVIREHAVACFESQLDHLAAAYRELMCHSTRH